MPFTERNYIDPWDVENYIYLRKGATSTRRRSVCFDQAVKYASYPDDGYGPIYGSLVEPNLKTSGSDYPDDRSLYIYNSLSPPSQCPSCYRDFNELDDYYGLGMQMGAEAIYEDLMARTLMRNQKTRRKRFSTALNPKYAEPKFGMNNFGYPRIDYSNNWNRLDRIIGS